MIIGFAGKAGSGKDTCADYLVNRHGFRKISWAGPLKAALAAMGFAEPEDRAAKESLIDGFDFTWRQAAQTLGTEWGRALDPDIWVKAVGRQIATAPKFTDFVISDVRFENEAAMIRQLGGVVVHLVGREADLGVGAGHVSEQPLRRQFRDQVVGNASTMDDLTSQLNAVVYVMGLTP